MIGLCRGEPPLGCFVLSPKYHVGRGSLSSEPWNKCDYFYENKRIITIHSLFCSYFVSIFAGRAHYIIVLLIMYLSNLTFSPCPLEF